MTKLWNRMQQLHCYEHELVKSLSDRDAWKTIQRLSLSFRIFCYILMPLGIASASSTFSHSEENSTYYIKSLSEIVALLGIIVPLVAVYGALKMRRKVILSSITVVFLCQICYRIVWLVLNAKSNTETMETPPEYILSIVNIVIGGFLVLFGLPFHRKVRHMDFNARNVLVVGLDNSGKTSLLHHMLPVNNDIRRIDINPTPGLELFHFKKWDTKWKIWDMSGQGRNRVLWSAYFSNVQAIVFVVDLNDLSRIGNAKDEFQSVVNHPIVKDRMPLLLVFGNKVDQSNIDSMTIPQIRNVLRIDALSQHFKVKVLPSSGLSGAGVQEGFQWIKDQTKIHS